MGACFSHMLVAGEKLSLWFACTSLVCCMVLTILIVLGLGIGLGYNFCFVDMKTRYKYVPAHYIYPGNLRWPSERAKTNVLRTIDDDIVKLGNEFDSRDTPVNPATPPMITVDPQHDEIKLYKTTENSTILHALMSNNIALNDTIRSNNLTDAIASNNEDASYKDVITPKSLEAILNSEEKPLDSIKKSVIPITGLNLMNLLAKLKETNSNYSIQIVEA